MENEHRRCLKKINVGEVVEGELDDGKIVVRCMNCPWGKMLVTLDGVSKRIAGGVAYVEGAIKTKGKVSGCKN